MYEARKLRRSHLVGRENFGFPMALVDAPVVRVSLRDTARFMRDEWYGKRCPLIFDPVLTESVIDGQTSVFATYKASTLVWANESQVGEFIITALFFPPCIINNFNPCFYVIHNIITREICAMRVDYGVDDTFTHKIITDDTILYALEMYVCGVLWAAASFETVIIPPPASRGKREYLEHRMLLQPNDVYYELDLSKQRRYEKKPEPLGGTHASPREHDRRGHLRRLPGEKTTWVRSCKVGKPDAGRVMKDYIL
jgi:hypothetical protein